ncbi:restriction endonuclease-replacing protein A [Helicobacter pylori Hp M1]|uniref:Restriction endonuclease-replacing protein A n=1 Tax=Helicobacter pylori Hp H-24 TaxID=992039 RepID=J0ATB6_HELPX|nr:HTH domain-containing protein [Helicobacter pylori]EJB53093.1 restriction endonuclease-replacing protein A [Helicobacter pylori Hp H-24]EJC40471.1 restriction endonuclease-replacing protein A [Helicobacter pylori Hp M1]
MTYKELGKKVLEQAEKPLSTEEIWERACEMGLDKERPSIGRTPWSTIGSDLGKDKKQFYVARKKGNAFFYWLKSREREFPPQETPDSKEEDDGQSECSDTAEKQKNSFHERDLHPLLVKFLNEDPNFNLQCKTIYHEKCKKDKKGKGEWNYPDIVGVYFPQNDRYKNYKIETLEFLHHTGQNSYKLFSFELKVRINFSNLKESYFQAVSNSSWANEGYLVVFNIDDEVLNELRRLNQSFGIGVIKLESEISNSKILLPAKEREIDMQTLNMLIDDSPEDFKPFIKDINKQIKAGFDTHVKVAGLDPVLDDEAMRKHIEDKGIKSRIKNESALSFSPHF